MCTLLANQQAYTSPAPRARIEVSIGPEILPSSELKTRCRLCEPSKLYRTSRPGCSIGNRASLMRHFRLAKLFGLSPILVALADLANVVRNVG